MGTEDLAVPHNHPHHDPIHVWILTGHFRDLHDHTGENLGGTNTPNFYVPHRLICFKRWIYFDSWPLIYAVCSPQWATLNIQKANSDEGTLKPSSSNGK